MAKRLGQGLDTQIPEMTVDTMKALVYEHLKNRQQKPFCMECNGNLTFGRVEYVLHDTKQHIGYLCMNCQNILKGGNV